MIFVSPYICLLLCIVLFPLFKKSKLYFVTVSIKIGGLIIIFIVIVYLLYLYLLL